MNAGIDYGMGRTNVDHATGIRYGVISQNSVLQAWCDSAEADYGKPTCPKCGNDATATAEFAGEIGDLPRVPRRQRSGGAARREVIRAKRLA